MNLITKDSDIIIAGDSWGCGEWGWPNFPDIADCGILHKGLEEYLVEFGCTVKNVSKGGNSNLMSFMSLLEFNLRFQKNPPIVIWFQTDPFRDFIDTCHNNYKTTIHLFANKKLDEFLKIHDELLDINYERLNSFHVPIYCIGGLSKLNVSLMGKYSNLYPVIPSIIEMLTNEKQGIPYSNWIQTKGYNDEELFSEEIVDYVYGNCIGFFDKFYFYPDGQHPNRLAHKKIFDYLIDFKLPY
jgi:hypothetical protein